MAEEEKKTLGGLNNVGMGRFDRQAGRSSHYKGTKHPPIPLLEARKWALTELLAAGFDEEESLDNIDFLLTGALKVNYGMLRANLTRGMPSWLAERWPSWIAGLLKGRPAQYVIGEAPFYGRDFLVDERVLIPRPETELLIDWVLKDLRQAPPVLAERPTVLDMGTGSGVIALTLAAENKALTITAADISRQALAVARENRKRLQVDERVTFVESDLFESLGDKRYDIIVSNPPYIRRNGQEEMDASVVTYEPDLALYADHQGLALYESMAKKLSDYLRPGGRAYFEIGYDQGTDLTKIFQDELPQAQVDLKQDLAGLDRMIRVELDGNKSIKQFNKSN